MEFWLHRVRLLKLLLSNHFIVQVLLEINKDTLNFIHFNQSFVNEVRVFSIEDCKIINPNQGLS